MTARRAQKPIHFRSDKAAVILARHVRPGRSQAAVVEEALEKLDPEMAKEALIEAQVQRIYEILKKVPRGDGRTMARFDAEEYDESGDLR
jgi:hypothetical protein